MPIINLPSDFSEVVARKLSLNTKTVFTLEESSEYSGISIGVLRKWCNADIIPCSRVSPRFVYIKREELEEWMMSKRNVVRSLDESCVDLEEINRELSGDIIDPTNKRL